MTSKYADLIMGEPKAAPPKVQPKAPKPKPVEKLVYREPTLREQVDAWQALAWELNLHRTITMNSNAVSRCLERIDQFVNAHGSNDKSFVVATFWNEIAQKPDVGQAVAPAQAVEKPSKPAVNKPKSILARKPKVKKPVPSVVAAHA